MTSENQTTPAHHLAAKADPPTSLAAAREITNNGTAANMRNRLAAALNSYAGFTSRELAKILKADRHEVARRLPDLAKETPPRARQGAARRCSQSKRLAVTWFPV